MIFGINLGYIKFIGKNNNFVVNGLALAGSVGIVGVLQINFIRVAGSGGTNRSRVIQLCTVCYDNILASLKMLYNKAPTEKLSPI